MSLSNDQLALLIRFHGDHDLRPSRFDTEETSVLLERQLIERSKPAGYYRITPLGFRVTSAMRAAALETYRETEANHE